jgi:sec-independent protein translocase protein TatB
MMFDISWGELLLIGVVALIVIGPKELPGVLRTLGQWTGKLRRMASEFQAQFQEAMREAEMAELKKQVDEMTNQAQSYASFDPVGDVRREFEGVQRQIESAVSDQPKSGTSTPSAGSEGEAPVEASAASEKPSIGSNAEASAGAPTTAPKDSQPAVGSPDAQDAGRQPA